MTTAEILNLDKSKFPAFSAFAHNKLPLPGVKIREFLSQRLMLTFSRCSVYPVYKGMVLY